MIRYEFELDDLARTRFAISPMWETAAAIRALRNPSLLALHLPWIKQVRPQIKDLDLSLAFALLPRRGYIADFLTPPPSTPLADFWDELELVRSTSAAQIRNDIEILISTGNPRESLQPYLDDPRGAVAALGELLAEFWRRAVEPHWPRLRSLLEADLLYRSRRLTDGGVSLLFSDLHPRVSWSDGGVEVIVDCGDTPIELAGRGLVLVPSAFSCQKPSTMTEPPWQPTVIYPARGVGLLWESASAPPEALAKVLGKSRATLLGDLDAPRSTTDLAERLGMTPGGISQHLTALRDSGLVSARRNGRQVLYCRSPLADELVGVGEGVAVAS
jgi:DNA-binding transcriptional ArsR family regulator